MKGPRPLRALLTSWKPASPAAQALLTRDDALTQLTLAWEAAVGSGVAARSRPLRFRAGTLVVLTASSAWSDELSLLAPRILEALQRRCPLAHVRQLRFRVASGRSKVLFDALALRNAGAKRSVPAVPTRISANATVGRQPQAPPAKPGIDDVRAIIANLRALQEPLDEGRDRSGWCLCAKCGRRFHEGGPGATMCAPCSEAKRRTLESHIERALMQAPWLQFSDLSSHVPQASRSVAERVRQRLLARWESELHFAERRLRRAALTPQDRVLAWSYVMLLARLPQRELGLAVVSNVLGRDWAAALLHDRPGP